MFRTALRNVLAHKLRLLMTMLAVVLGVAFVAGTLVFTSTMNAGLQESSAKSFQDVSVAVRTLDSSSVTSESDGQKPTGIDRKTYQKLTALPGARGARGTVTGYTGVADQNNKLLGNGFTNRSGNFAPDKHGQDSRYHFTSGHGPTKASDVALDSKTAKKGDYQVGDTVRLSINGPVLKKRVVGVFDTDDGMVSSGGTLTLFDTATAQKLFLAPGLYSEVHLQAKPGVKQQELRDQAAEVLPKSMDLETVTGKQLVDDQAEVISKQTSSMKTMFLAFAGIALFVGIFLIANTFTMLVAQRTRELALLRALGASRRQVTRSVLTEATFVGAVSAVVGFGLGVGIAAGLRAILNANDAGLPHNAFVISSGSVLSSVLVGVGITVVAAWLPARRASRIPPVAAMSTADIPPKQRSLVVRNLIGAAFSAVGMLLILGVVFGDTGSDELFLGGGAALLLIGVIVLTPLLSRPVVALAAPLLRLFGFSGLLARKNAVRNPRRTAATATALMIGLTLISALSVITTSVKSGMEKGATEQLRADYAVQMANYTSLDSSVVDKVRQLPEVDAAAGDNKTNLELDGQNESVQSTDGAAFQKLFKTPATQGSFSQLDRRHIAVDDEMARKRHWSVGSSVSVKFDDGKRQRVTVGAVFEGSEMMDSVLVDHRMVGPHRYQHGDQTVFVKAKPGHSGDQLQESIKKKLGNSPIVQVQTQDELLAESNQMLDQMLYMVYGLLGMSVLVAVIGVVNTMAMSVFERAREIGMLRAIGLDRVRVRRMIRLESLVISLFGAVLGLGMGTFLAWAAGRLIRSSLDSYTMELPWTSYTVFLVLAVLVGILASLWPARRAARLNALEAIKAE